MQACFFRHLNVLSTIIRNTPNIARILASKYCHGYTFSSSPEKGKIPLNTRIIPSTHKNALMRPSCLVLSLFPMLPLPRRVKKDSPAFIRGCRHLLTYFAVFAVFAVFSAFSAFLAFLARVSVLSMSFVAWKTI